MKNQSLIVFIHAYTSVIVFNYKYANVDTMDYDMGESYKKGSTFSMMKRNCFIEVSTRIYRHWILDRHSRMKCNEGLGTISFNHPLETIINSLQLSSTVEYVTYCHIQEALYGSTGRTRILDPSLISQAQCGLSSTSARAYLCLTTLNTDYFQ